MCFAVCWAGTSFCSTITHLSSDWLCWLTSHSSNSSSAWIWCQEAQGVFKIKLTSIAGTRLSATDKKLQLKLHFLQKMTSRTTWKRHLKTFDVNYSNAMTLTQFWIKDKTRLNWAPIHAFSLPAIISKRLLIFAFSTAVRLKVLLLIVALSSIYTSFILHWIQC